MSGGTEQFLLLLVTIAGGLVSWLLAWKDTDGAFDIDRAWPSWIRIAVAALAVFAADYIGLLPDEITMTIYISAFFAGMAVDAGGNRLAGVLLGN